MLTYDDLDHFDEHTMAGLFDPAAMEQAQARRERILACLHFCRDVPSDRLPADGLANARRLLRRAVRSQQRHRPGTEDGLASCLVGALLALGEESAGGEAEAAGLRQAMEREIEAAARSRSLGGTALPILLEALAQGDFELGAASDLAALAEAGRKFNGSAEVALELRLDQDGRNAPLLARLRLTVSCGLWRWSAPAGAEAVLGDEAPVRLAADDEILPVLLAGLALQNGRTAALWAAAVRRETAG